jgi:tRNA (cytidine32/uridine32-2'-O)-methyltransferase
MTSIGRKLRIVLVETSHPGNIGAAARAMKTMCLERLYLVRPQRYPHAEATARASGAIDLLREAVVCDSLHDALHDTVLVIGTSARMRAVQWPQLDPRACASTIIREAAAGEAALVFGRESSGLTNSELGRCNFVTTIPCNPAYGSLNLAAAVQVMGYELMMHTHDASAGSRADAEPLAPTDEVERFYEHLEQTLVELDFLNPANPRHLMRRLRRLFNRARLTAKEVNILRGMLTAALRGRIDKNRG